MSAALIPDSLPKLSDAEHGQGYHALDAVFHARHQVVLDDAYGTMTEEDFTNLPGEAWSVIDGTNKVPGIRAALIHDHLFAKQGVENDHMNILCMGVRTVGPGSGSGLGEDLHRGGLQLRTWYLRRLGKVTPSSALHRTKPARYRESPVETRRASREKKFGRRPNCGTRAREA